MDKPKGQDSPNWKGGRRVVNGRVYIHAPGHPHAAANNYVLEHIFLAVKALGRPLPDGTLVHHMDEDPSNNKNNLVILQDKQHHGIIHQRTNAVKAGYPPNYRKCLYCKNYDHPDNLTIRSGYKTVAYHKQCDRTYQKQSNDRKRLLQQEDSSTS